MSQEHDDFLREKQRSIHVYPFHLMSLKECAGYMQVHPMTIYKLAREGKMPAAKVSGQWRFERETVRQWVIQRMNENLSVCSNLQQEEVDNGP